MLKNKLLLLSVVLFAAGCIQADAQNIELSDLTAPKAPAYRVGISEIPENQYIQAIEDKTAENDDRIRINDMADGDSTDVSYSDLSIKNLSREIAQELDFEENDMVSDLSLLWQGAAMQSDTINFALYKLANPDADKPDKSAVKKMLQTVASMSTLVGAGVGNPLLAGTSLIGGNLLSIMSQDTKALNYKYTKVTDADMIILIRKVEDLQQNAVNLYYDYMTAKKQLELTTQLVKDRQKRFQTAQKNNASRELIVVSDAYFRTALDKQRTAKSEFFSKRAALEQFVGNETFTQFENELAQREYDRNKSDEEVQAYNDTIQSVENYTNSLSENLPYMRSANDYYDSNLNKLPDIMPLEDEKSTYKEEAVEKEVEVVNNNSVTKKEKTKKDKYSTKGLIFIHNEQQTTKEEQTSKKSDKKTKKSKTKNNEQKVDINYSTPNPHEALPKTKHPGGEVDLLPLDEIKAPYYHNNKSIFEN
ncbi:hypothetical protein J6G99_08110 [bacterium]|nr:hypothetical protein [bacterium]